jgi:long-chain acyl-CoA synthetase
VVVAGINVIVGDYVGPDDALLSYLPLAHIFEFVMENAALQWGTLQGYGSSRTLSQANCVNCKGDIQEFKPTILVGIPAIWETVRKGVIENVNKSSVVARSLFWAAFAAKRYRWIY